MRDCDPQRATAEALGKFGGGLKLLSGKPAAQYRCAYIAQFRLVLRMNAHVVAKDVVRNLFRNTGQQLEVEPRLKLGKKAVRGPSLLEKKMFEPCAVTAIAQSLLLAKYLGNGSHRAHGLIGKDEGVKTDGQVRIGGEAATYAQRVTHFAVVLDSSQADVVDLRVSTPRRATGDGYLEFARQVIELRIGREQTRDFQGKRRAIDKFIGSYPGQGAAGHVSHYIAARSLGRKSDGIKRIHHLWERLNGEPVQLNVLTDSDVSQITRVFAREPADDTKLA